MRSEQHSYDFVVVGGGMAGLLAALAAARHGVKTALVQDRPVLGGNASSEIRMHICGAHGSDMRETGILEELLLENQYRNPSPCYSIWDSVLYGAARYQDNLDLFLNCSVMQCEMDGTRVQSVTGWQMTSETWHTLSAKVFADCSGDGILAPLTGADFRIGREGRAEYSESIAPETADQKTMGLTCLVQGREHATPQPFIPPAWAHKFTKPEDLRGRGVNVRSTNFWWMEVGGEQDSIHDTERLRDELLKIAFGVWDYIKNYSDQDAENWALDWVGFLPGKRESRRYLGDHVLTQNDIATEGRFDDVVAYGGWSMDDHFPAGFYHPEAGTIFHPAPSPFGIPYRSLYSRNIENLFCAGRSHSASHAAMSATRVMATTAMMGQAVGTAAALAVREGATPRGVYEGHLTELQATLQEDDSWLPWSTRPISDSLKAAQLSASEGNPEPLRSGVDRPVGEETHAWIGTVGASVVYEFTRPMDLSSARIVFDSDLNRNQKNMPHAYFRDAPFWGVPKTLVKRFRLEAQNGSGDWETVYSTENNYQRLVRVPIQTRTRAVRLVLEETWGAEAVRVFSFDVR